MSSAITETKKILSKIPVDSYFLLSSASSMTRGPATRPVPALWSIETLTFRSVPNGGQK